MLTLTNHAYVLTISILSVIIMVNLNENFIICTQVVKFSNHLPKPTTIIPERKKYEKLIKSKELIFSNNNNNNYYKSKTNLNNYSINNKKISNLKDAQIDSDNNNNDEFYVDILVNISNKKLIDELSKFLVLNTNLDTSIDGSSSSGSSSTKTSKIKSKTNMSYVLNDEINNTISEINATDVFHITLKNDLPFFMSINEKTKQIFKDFKVYFLILIILLTILIISIVVLITVNFVMTKKYAKNFSRRSKMMKTKKKNASFDIIDNGYAPNRNSFRFFNRSTSITSEMVVDHDYQFENFTNLNRTYDRITDSNENFYELPYIDGSSSNEPKNGTIRYENNLKFKTFTARKLESMQKATIENIKLKKSVTRNKLEFVNFSGENKYEQNGQQNNSPVILEQIDSRPIKK